MQNYFTKLKNLSLQKWLFCIFVFSLGLTLLINELSEKPAKSKNMEEPFDTYIPAGFVLVPIDVQNYEALDSVLGSYGVVDLYKSAGQENTNGRRVARAVKILRAPLNPNHFAVLVEEFQAQEIAKSFDPFIVVVQNPKTIGTQIEMAKKKINLKPIYYGDE